MHTMAADIPATHRLSAVLVYPQVEKQVSAEEAEHAREEHAEAEETLQRLEKLDADDPAFDDELATLMAEIRHHIKDEEGQMFVHMRQVIDVDNLRTLGDRVEAFKEGGADPAAPARAERAAAADGGGSGGIAVHRMRDLATGRGR